MSKRKIKKLIAASEFVSVEHAREVKETYEHKKIRIWIGLGIAAVATVLTIVGIKNNSIDYMCYALLPSIVSYIIGGGFGKALKLAFKLGKIGWLLAFPSGIAVGLLTMLISAYIFLFFPAFFVFMNYRQNNLDYEAAQIYLSRNQAVVEDEKPNY